MKLAVSKLDVWSADLEDRPGGLAEKLAQLAKAGANLQFVLARRKPDQPGKGVVFLAPIKGAGQKRAAGEAGFTPAADLCAVRVEGPDKPGLGARMAQALADEGINIRGLSAVVVGRRFVVFLALDTAADAAKAAKALKRLA